MNTSTRHKWIVSQAPEIVRLYTVEKLTVAQISARGYGTPRAVTAILRQNNVSMRFASFTDEQVRAIIHLYTVEKLSMSEVARRLDTARQNVRRLLITRGLGVKHNECVSCSRPREVGRRCRFHWGLRVSQNRAAKQRSQRQQNKRQEAA
jgi:transposase-like protein